MCYQGWGLRARERIPKGTFIIEYVGEVISTDMCQDRFGTLSLSLYTTNFLVLML